MFYRGKVYRVKRASTGVKAMLSRHVDETAREMFDPVADFMARIGSLQGADRQAAVTAFFSSGQHKDIPEIYRMRAAATLETARFLVRELIPDFSEEVTEYNRAELLKGIAMHHADPEREKILEIKKMREAESGQSS